VYNIGDGSVKLSYGLFRTELCFMVELWLGLRSIAHRICCHRVRLGGERDAKEGTVHFAS